MIDTCINCGKPITVTDILRKALFEPFLPGVRGVLPYVCSVDCAKRYKVKMRLSRRHQEARR